MKKHFLLITALSVFSLTPVMGGDLNNSLEMLADALKNLIPHLMSAGEDVKPDKPDEPSGPEVPPPVEPKKPDEPELPVADETLSLAQLQSLLTPELKDFAQIKERLAGAKVAVNEAAAFRMQILLRLGIWVTNEELSELTGVRIAEINPEEPRQPASAKILLPMKKVRTMLNREMGHQKSFDKAINILRTNNVRVSEAELSSLQDFFNDISISPENLDVLNEFVARPSRPDIIPSAPKEFVGVPIDEILNILEVRLAEKGVKYGSVLEAIVDIQDQGGEIQGTPIKRRLIIQDIEKRLVAKKTGD